MPPGAYPIGVDAGPLLTAWIPDKVTMTAERGCEDASVVLHPSGRLTGRLVSATGRPVEGQQLRVLDAAGNDRRLAGSDFSQPTTADGRFEFDGLPPGEYLVALTRTDFRTVGRRTAPFSLAARTAPPRRGYASGRTCRSRCPARSSCRRR